MRAGSFAGSLFIRIRDAKKFLFFIFFGILYVKDKEEEDAGESLEHP